MSEGRGVFLTWSHLHRHLRLHLRLPKLESGATCAPRLRHLQAASAAEMGSWAADIRALLSAGRHSQTDREGDGRNSQTEARRSIAEVPRARRSSIHSTAL